MIFTHDEAKTKWCPFSRVALSAVGLKAPAMGVNRVKPRDTDDIPAQMESLTCCIADGCMAWRSGPDKTVWDDKGNADYLPRGYCGLAGKP